jgi:sugar O-acyltransferase (sialic acid O-acetyltransferase NeuD family)
MSKPPIVLVGAGGHAQSCIDVIEQQDVYRIIGLVGMPHEVGRSVLGYPVVGTDDELPALARDCSRALVSVGHIRSADLRMRLYRSILSLGFKLPTIVSPRAYVSRHATLGAATIVMHDALINAGAIIGLNCIINSRSLIEHGTLVRDHCHIATRAVLNGDVEIGEGSFIGSGSLVKDGVSLGDRCIVGMGVCVRHDQPNDTRIINSL